VLLLPCSKGVKISVIYRYIGDWIKQKIGISKCKNMHIGATLMSPLPPSSSSDNNSDSDEDDDKKKMKDQLSS